MALKPLTLEQLVGTPLRALVVGQEAASQATADFVFDVGFEPGPDKTPVVRQIEFEYVHPVPDPSNPGEIIETPTRVRVPLLTMFPVLNLHISEATITFGVNIVDVKASPKGRRLMALEREQTVRDGTSVQLIGEYAPAVSHPSRPGPTVTMSIKVNKEQPTEGFSRILGQLSDAITSAPKARPKPR